MRSRLRLSTLLGSEVWLEQRAQLHAPAMQAALERRLTDADHRCRVGGREALDIAQYDGRAPVPRQLSQRLLEDGFELPIERARVRTEMGRLRERRHRIVAVRVRFDARQAPASEPSLCLVEGDPVQPGRQLRALLKAGQTAPCAQEDLLRDVLRLAGIEPESPQRTVNASGMRLHQLTERALISSASALDQLVFFQRGGGNQAPTLLRERPPGQRPPARGRLARVELQRTGIDAEALGRLARTVVEHVP
jgi:hypothetical protein